MGRKEKKAGVLAEQIAILIASQEALLEAFLIAVDGYNSVPGQATFKVIGRANTPSNSLNSPDPVWPTPGVGSLNERPTSEATEVMSVYSTDDAEDNGVDGTIHSGTSTSGSATTLVDTGADFTAGTAVAALEDRVFLPALSAVGTITAVTATTITCAQGFRDITGATVTPSTDTYKILDGGAKLGALVVCVRGLDADYTDQAEYVLTNGTTEVNTVNSYLRINDFYIVLAGETHRAFGDVKLVVVGAVTQI